MVAVKGSRGVVLTSLVVLLVARLVTSQITFSRDWTGGKRSAPAPAPLLDCSQFARLCRHFLHEMRASGAEAEPRPAKHRRLSDDTPPLYEDE